MRRLRIYVAIGKQPDLSHSGGDVLNEIQFYRRLSTFADVFYNGQLITWDSPGFGIERRPLEIPNESFDLYYIRNNPELALSCPGPLMVMAYPYSHKVWKKADSVLVTTEAWRSMLTGFNAKRPKRSVQEPWYPRRIVTPRQIFLAEQSISPNFAPAPDDPRSRAFRARFGLGFTVGHVGRVDPTSFPWAATTAVDRLRRSGRGISYVFLGNVRDVEIPDWAVIWPREKHEEMRFVTSAFDCLVYDQDDTGNWAGSNKVLEAMACGVPILLRRYDARREQVGDDYPLFYDDADEAQSKIARLQDDPGWHRDISEMLVRRAAHFSHEAVTKRLGNELSRLLDHLDTAR